MNSPSVITSATRQIPAAESEFLNSLVPGQRLQITQTVRVGAKTWKTTVNGIFRGINYLATGVTTDRVPEDDVVVPMLHFVKDNGELSSIAIDEHSEVKALSDSAGSR